VKIARPEVEKPETPSVVRYQLAAGRRMLGLTRLPRIALAYLGCMSQACLQLVCNFQRLGIIMVSRDRRSSVCQAMVKFSKPADNVTRSTGFRHPISRLSASHVDIVKNARETRTTPKVVPRPFSSVDQ
jgi:hypothetical protein